MSDYIAIEHNAETGETIERTMTQDEIDALMATFAGFNESTIVEPDTDNSLPNLDSGTNPLPEDSEL
jgi:antibiotic biosynthesis monooxygenase (ABM) superfamily enzyme